MSEDYSKQPEKKFREAIELFDEKTNEIVRKIRFKNPTDIYKFLDDFKAMRYPGYSWRYIDKWKK
jgi:hypothetical protein